MAGRDWRLEIRDRFRSLGGFGATLGLVWLLALSVDGVHADAPKPPLVDALGVDQKLGVQAPLDLTFRDEAWRAVPLKTYFDGKPVILTLNYYNCKNICSTELDDLVGKLSTMGLSIGDEYTIVSVSINPRETPQVAAYTKKSFVRRYPRPGVESNWHFLTGDEASIRELTDTVGFRYAWDERMQEYAHPAAILILTPQGKVSHYLYSPIYTAQDLRLSLVEASQNKIGTAIDRVLLFCYRYDPTAGTYSAAILNIVRLGGVVTMLGLGLFLTVMVRRDKASAV
jgi:protein SCO1